MENNSNPKVIDFSNDFAPVVGSTSSNVQEFKDTVSKMTDIFIAKTMTMAILFLNRCRNLARLPASR